MPPFIWSAAVWYSLDAEYLAPRGQTLWDLCSREHPETFIYNEAVLNFRAIPLHPIEQLFRVYYYDWHYFLLRRLGESIPKLKENYLGVIYQSSWDLSLDLGASKKSVFSRALKKSSALDVTCKASSNECATHDDHAARERHHAGL